MNQCTKTLAAAGLLLALTAPPAHATCDTAITATTPTAAFTDNGDGTITDTRTGLMWKQCSQGQSGTDCATDTATTFKWGAALAEAGVANAASFADHSDWRLPNAKELSSIVEQRCGDPAINAALFPSTSATTRYWSSSPYADSAGYAWSVDFGNGGVSTNAPGNDFAVRLVRAGQ